MYDAGWLLLTRESLQAISLGSLLKSILTWTTIVATDEPTTAEVANDVCPVISEKEEVQHITLRHHVDLTVLIHSKDGLPTCFGCGNKFTRWDGLHRH